MVIEKYSYKPFLDFSTLIELFPAKKYYGSRQLLKVEITKVFI